MVYLDAFQTIYLRRHCVTCYTYTWCYMATHGVTWLHMVLHGYTWCYLPPHGASPYLRDCQHVLKLKLHHLDSRSESEWHKLIMPLVGGQSLKRPLSTSIFGRLLQKSYVFAFLALKNYNLAKNTIWLKLHHLDWSLLGGGLQRLRVCEPLA